jgi:antitoxin CptB
MTSASAAALDTQRATLDALELRRLRWRARRGLLENDLLIERFLNAHGATLRTAELDALKVLLELPDNDLLDLLLARKEPEGDLRKAHIEALLTRLRHC